MTVTVRYFASLREEAGIREEEIDTSAGTPRELYEELKEMHGFRLKPENLRISLNNQFGDWDASLEEGDSISFLPPVAGG